MIGAQTSIKQLNYIMLQGKQNSLLGTTVSGTSSKFRTGAGAVSGKSRSKASQTSRAEGRSCGSGAQHFSINFRTGSSTLKSSLGRTS